MSLWQKVKQRHQRNKENFFTTLNQIFFWMLLAVNFWLLWAMLQLEPTFWESVFAISIMTAKAITAVSVLMWYVFIYRKRNKKDLS